VRKALLLCLTLLPSLALAQAEALENPGSVAAVQDRLYRLNHELSLGIGVMPADAFYKGYFAGVGYTYHFNDFFAWQVGRGSYNYNVKTSLRRQLERDFGVVPTATAFEDEVQWMVGSDVALKPLYGKFSFFNQKVLHFEAYVLAGASIFKLNREGGLRPAANVGLGMRFFKSQNISFRLDVTNNFLFTGPRVVNVPTVQLATAINFGATE
jgi:outer membrane beta-barrel protein